MIYALILLFVLLLSLGVYTMKLQQSLQQQARELTLLEQQLESLHNDVAGLSAGAVGMGAAMQSQRQRLAEMDQRQDKLDTESDAREPYVTGARMAQSGASVEELVQALGISTAEADLLIRLHA